MSGNESMSNCHSDDVLLDEGLGVAEVSNQW